jgi:hypothetical protein
MADLAGLLLQAVLPGWRQFAMSTVWSTPSLVRTRRGTALHWIATAVALAFVVAIILA